MTKVKYKTRHANRPYQPEQLSNNQIQNKDVLVSIILTESTTSLFNLDLPHLEDFSDDETVCSIMAENSIDDVKQAIGCEKVTSDIAFFCTNPNIFDSDTSLDIVDDLSDCILSTDDMELKVKDFEDVILKSVKIYTRPLCTVKSTAHQDKMRIEDNNIYISTRSSELSITGSGWINVCRICHGGESIGNLLSPCRCRGSIALAHIKCLERWLRQSASSRCELCQHHYHILREPRYSIPWSVLVFLRHPGEHCREIIFDMLAFIIYTPSAAVSTYMLKLLCEQILRSHLQYEKDLSGHFMAFIAIFGMAAINFTYASWLAATLQRHTDAWRNWYRNNCSIKLVLPARKQKRKKEPRKRIENGPTTAK